VFELDLVQTSCGMAVPNFNFVDQREQLNDYWSARSPEQIEQYWKDKNTRNIDGKPTNIFKGEHHG
jgi:hypothetical protein